jgi:hypothetical protein
MKRYDANVTWRRTDEVVMETVCAAVSIASCWGRIFIYKQDKILQRISSCLIGICNYLSDRCVHGSGDGAIEPVSLAKKDEVDAGEDAAEKQSEIEKKIAIKSAISDSGDGAIEPVSLAKKDEVDAGEDAAEKQSEIEKKIAIKSAISDLASDCAKIAISSGFMPIKLLSNILQCVSSCLKMQQNVLKGGKFWQKKNKDGSIEYAISSPVKVITSLAKAAIVVLGFTPIAAGIKTWIVAAQVVITIIDIGIAVLDVAINYDKVAKDVKSAGLSAKIIEILYETAIIFYSVGVSKYLVSLCAMKELHGLLGLVIDKMLEKSTVHILNKNNSLVRGAVRKIFLKYMPKSITEQSSEPKCAYMPDPLTEPAVLLTYMLSGLYDLKNQVPSGSANPDPESSNVQDQPVIVDAEPEEIYDDANPMQTSGKTSVNLRQL